MPIHSAAFCELLLSGLHSVTLQSATGRVGSKTQALPRLLTVKDTQPKASCVKCYFIHSFKYLLSICQAELDLE